MEKQGRRTHDLDREYPDTLLLARIRRQPAAIKVQGNRRVGESGWDGVASLIPNIDLQRGRGRTRGPEKHLQLMQGQAWRNDLARDPSGKLALTDAWQLGGTATCVSRGSSVSL